jgi:hypothetical protein
MSWIFCVSSQFATKEKWFFNTKSAATKIISGINDNICDLFVVSLLSHNHLEIIGETVKEVCAHFKSAAHFICLYSDESIYRAFHQNLTYLNTDTKWQEGVVRLPNWTDLDSFLQVVCGTEKNCEGIKVKLFSGIDFTIAPQIGNDLQKSGIEVVGTNQYFEQKNATDSMSDYLKGNSIWPSWNVFYFNEYKNRPRGICAAVVHREIADQLKKDLEQLAMKARKCVSMKKILHQPGAGASTVAMCVMWELRNTYKCIRVNGEEFFADEKLEERMKNLSEKILFFRGIGESNETVKGISSECKPILILLDNTTEVVAKALRKSLEDRVNENSDIGYFYTMFLLLYLVQKVDARFISDETSDTLCMRQELTRSDKKLFQKKLDELKMQNLEPPKMLEFVIMAHNYQSSDYVTQVIRDTFGKNHAYRNQEQMLLYLSTLKHFAGMGLPTDVCFSIKENEEDFEGKLFKGMPTVNPISSLCPQAKIFLTQKNCTIKLRSGDFPCLFFEVSHAPVAKELFNFLSRGKSLSAILFELFNEPSIMSGEERFQELMFFTVRKLLGEFKLLIFKA